MSEQHPPTPEERQPADATNIGGGVNLNAGSDISIFKVANAQYLPFGAGGGRPAWKVHKHFPA